ncbi:MAG: Rid family hydrolase [Microbacterium sp.]
MHERILPTDVFEPVPGLYTQLIACQAGDRFEIAGTLPYHQDGSLDPDLATQSAVVMENIGRTLASAGLERSDIVRINIFTIDMDGFLRTSLDTVFGWFGAHRPTSTLVEIRRLANPNILVEIEAVAIRAERD